MFGSNKSVAVWTVNRRRVNILPFANFLPNLMVKDGFFCGFLAQISCRLISNDSFWWFSNLLNNEVTELSSIIFAIVPRTDKLHNGMLAEPAHARRCTILRYTCQGEIIIIIIKPQKLAINFYQFRDHNFVSYKRSHFIKTHK